MVFAPLVIPGAWRSEHLAGSGWLAQGPHLEHELEVTSTPSFLSHAKVWRETRVSCYSEIPWPGLEHKLGGRKLGSEMLLHRDWVYVGAGAPVQCSSRVRSS